MGDLVSFHDDIDNLGREFTRGARQLNDALARVQQASDHVRHAFHNHPERADAAVAPFAKLREPVARVQELVNGVGRQLLDVAAGYRDNDTVVAKGWERSSTSFGEPGRR